MQYIAQKSEDTPKGKLCIDTRALTHYLSNMVYIGEHKNNFNADAYIGGYKLKHCRKSPCS